MPERVASEVLSAMVGGMFSASALYPLEVLKTRMQAEAKPSSNPQEETVNNNETSSTASNSNNNNDEEESNSTTEKQTLKNQYTHAATEGMSSYASLMYQHEGGIAPFYAGGIDLWRKVPLNAVKHYLVMGSGVSDCVNSLNIASVGGRKE
eukprot:scaffold32780_cov78-Skeletonema_dohrnii-CCMP3373.AAC.1